MIKTFHTVAGLAARFDGLVFQDIEGDFLFVYDRMSTMWYCYRWTPGHREIVFVCEVTDDLPIVLQTYPPV